MTEEQRTRELVVVAGASLDVLIRILQKHNSDNVAIVNDLNELKALMDKNLTLIHSY